MEFLNNSAINSYMDRSAEDESCMLYVVFIERLLDCSFRTWDVEKCYSILWDALLAFFYEKLERKHEITAHT